MIGKLAWRTALFLPMGTAACLFLASHPASLGGGDAVAGTKFEKVSSFRILGAGLGNPTDVTMVNQVVPRFSMYSNPTVPLIEILNRFDLLVTTANNLTGLPTFDGFPPGAVARVVRPTFPNKKNPPPDNNGDGRSDNVTVYSENSEPFVLGNSPTVITPGGGNILETARAGDDTIFGQTLLTGPNGFPEAGLCGDDVQLIPVGTSGLGVATPVVGPGPNGLLETNPGNVGVADDIVGPTSGCPLRNICAGPDGVATSGLGGNDIQNLPCVGHFLEPTDVVLHGRALGGGDGNRVLETPAGGDDVPVIMASQDLGVGFAARLDADTTACQTNTGAPIIGCDDVQVTPVGTAGLANDRVVVVGAGPNGVLETSAFSCIIAGEDGIAGSVVCTDASGVPLPGPCDDVQLVAPGTSGLGVQVCVVATGPNNFLETIPQFTSFFIFDGKSADAGGIQAGPNRTAESGPPRGDDVAIVLTPQIAPNIDVPPVNAPVGIESVVTMYPAVANMGDPATKAAASGSVTFLATGAFSIGSNGDNIPRGDTKRLLFPGLAVEGPRQLGVISGLEGATGGSQGFLTGLSGFVYGGFAWTDISFKRPNPVILPPDLKDNAYYATRNDGGIVMISYTRGRVSDVLAPGIIDAPTDLGFVAQDDPLCIGLNRDGGAGVAANCGPQDPPGTDAGKLYVIESGTGRIAVVPLVIDNDPFEHGLCASTTSLPSSLPSNPESFQGGFCDPATGRRIDGSPCSGTSPGVCVTEGVGLPNTRVVADVGNVSFITHPFLTDPVGIVMFTPFPVPHTGRLTTGGDGIVDSVAAGDDIQLIPLGQGFPEGRAIDAALIGNVFDLQTTPLGDDVIIGGGNSPSNPQRPGGFPPNTVTTGPDGIADTLACNPNPPGSCSDVQNIPVGRGEPFKPAISAGPNGIIDTLLAGDDTIVRSPSLFIANGDGTVVWMDLNGLDPFTHTGPPRIMRPGCKDITGIGIGDYLNGEGMQILLTTTDFGGAVVSFDPTLSDNSPSLAARLVILNDLNDTVSTKLDPSQVPIPIAGATLPTGITHVARDSWPGRDGYIGTPDDVVFSNPANMISPTNISFLALSEPNEMTVDGSGANIYAGAPLGRAKPVPAGSYSVNTLNSPIDGVLLNDPTIDLYNFISGNIFIHVGLFPKRPNSILAGPDLIVQTTACEMPGGAPITPCDDVQLTLAGDMVFPGPRGMSILAGTNGVAESGLGGDDVQVSPVGTTFSSFAVTPLGVPYAKPSPLQPVVSAGTNGVLNTCPARDDTVGAGSAGVMAGCPGVVADLASCPTDFRELGLGCTVPDAGCPANVICTGPNGIADTGIALDDLQINPPRSTGLAATATVVAPGKDEFIETSPGGDDFLGGGLPLQVVIEPGPDNILQTPPAAGDIVSRLTPLAIVDLDVFAFSRPITSLETPTMPYAFLAANGTGVNSGVVDISGGFTANALDAAVDAVFPSSSSFFGPSFESPTGEIDFTVRDISLTAFIDNISGMVFGRGVERNSQLPALSLLYQDASLGPANNAFVGSAIIGRQLVQTPDKTRQLDRSEKAAKKAAEKAAKAAKKAAEKAAKAAKKAAQN